MADASTRATARQVADLIRNGEFAEAAERFDELDPTDRHHLSAAVAPALVRHRAHELAYEMVRAIVLSGSALPNAVESTGVASSGGSAVDSTDVASSVASKGGSGGVRSGGEIDPADQLAICEAIAEAGPLDSARAELRMAGDQWSVDIDGFMARIEERAGNLNAARELAGRANSSDPNPDPGPHSESHASLARVVSIRLGVGYPRKIPEHLDGPRHHAVDCYRLWASRAFDAGDLDSAVDAITRADAVALELDKELGPLLDLSHGLAVAGLSRALIGVRRARVRSDRVTRAAIARAASGIGFHLRSELAVLEAASSASDFAAAIDRIHDLMRRYRAQRTEGGSTPRDGDGPTHSTTTTLGVDENSEPDSRTPDSRSSRHDRADPDDATGSAIIASAEVAAARDTTPQAAPETASTVTQLRIDLVRSINEMMSEGAVDDIDPVAEFEQLGSNTLVADWHAAKAIHLRMGGKNADALEHIDTALDLWIEAGEFEANDRFEVLPASGHEMPAKFWEVVTWLHQAEPVPRGQVEDTPRFLKWRAFTEAGIATAELAGEQHRSPGYFTASLRVAYDAQLADRTRYALYNLAWVLSRIGRYDTAAIVFSIIRDLPGTYVEFRAASIATLADIAARQGHLDLARTRLTDAARMSMPLEAGLHLTAHHAAWLAVLCARWGLLDIAAQLLDRFPAFEGTVAQSFNHRLARMLIEQVDSPALVSNLMAELPEDPREYPTEMLHEIAARILLERDDARGVVELVGDVPAAGESLEISRLRLEALRVLQRREGTWSVPLYTATTSHIDRRRQSTVSPNVLIARLDASGAQLDAEAREAQQLVDDERLRVDVASHLESTLLHDLGSPILVLTAAHDLGWRNDSEVVQSTITQLRSLSDELVDLETSVNKQRELVPVEVGPIIARSRQAAEALAQRKSIEIEVAISPAVEHASVTADETMLDRCTANLVSNAVKFTPVGGAVRIEVSDHAGYVHLTVSDTGPGFTAQDLAQVGKRLGRLSARPTAGEGSHGLGLFATQQMCEAQNIELSFENGPTTGAICAMRVRYNEPTAAVPLDPEPSQA